jgi:hypothetical protein
MRARNIYKDGLEVATEEFVEALLDELPSGAGNIVSATPPPSPAIGQGWLDSEDRVFAVWDGTVWVGQEFLPIILDEGGFAFLGEPLLFLGEVLTSETII